MTFYTDPAQQEWLKAAYAEHRRLEQPGGVCDMTLYAEFCQSSGLHIRDMAAIIAGNTHDPNVNLSLGYEMRQGYKHFDWHDNQPYCKDTASGELVRFSTIHCQGHAKHLMSELRRPL